MNDNNKETDDFKNSLGKVLAAIKESNTHAQKRNRLTKRQYKQSVLNYEQVERQYLIEKSRLQPEFRLSVTEFLACEPDFLNDPEQAGEAKYLADLGLEVDQRVLRIKLDVKGDAIYMQPSIVIETSQKAESRADERVHAMTERLYFVGAESINIDQSTDSIDVYLVYRDKTTLPVIHKYRLIKRAESTLLRWDAMHLDTAYVSSHKKLSRFKSAAGCARLFANREQD